MLNKREIVFMIRDLKAEFVEAVEKGISLVEGTKEKQKNDDYRNYLVNEMLRLKAIVDEEERAKAQEERDRKIVDFVFDKYEEDEAFMQNAIVSKFRDTLKKIFNEYKGASLKEMTDNQRRTILAGFKDRVGLDVDQAIIKFVLGFNYEQANQTIRILSGISFYQQRVNLTNAIKTLKHRPEYPEIAKQAMTNIHSRAWFEAKKDLLVAIGELQPATDAQVRLISSVSRYVETAYTLKESFGIDVQDYEYRPVIDGDQKLYYKMNWELLRKDLGEKVNRESASNFIQTWGYLQDQYKGRELESHERAHLRGLYMQLGDYELTRPSHLNTIMKDNYNALVLHLEHQVRMNKAMNNTSMDRWLEEIRNTSTKSVAKQYKDITLTREETEHKELFSFVRNIYAVVGQDIPEEMRRILPDSYSQNRQTVYVGVAPEHIAEFRRLVLQQRKVVKEVYLQYNNQDSQHRFNWGAFIAEQPEHILELLGLADMM